MMTAWFRHGDMREANEHAYGGRSYYANARLALLFAGYGISPPRQD